MPVLCNNFKVFYMNVSVVIAILGISHSRLHITIILGWIECKGSEESSKQSSELFCTRCESVELSGDQSYTTSSIPEFMAKSNKYFLLSICLYKITVNVDT